MKQIIKTPPKSHELYFQLESNLSIAHESSEDHNHNYLTYLLEKIRFTVMLKFFIFLKSPSTHTFRSIFEYFFYSINANIFPSDSLGG